MVRPFTLSRLSDLIRLAQTSRGITADDVEEAMMVTRDRATELIKQAEEMKLVKLDGSLYHSTHLGNDFFEAIKNDDSAKLDSTLEEYSPYLKIKNILSVRSINVTELKKQTGFTEVAIEIVLRLLSYVRDDICSVNEKFFLRAKELPEQARFLSSVKKIYSELGDYAQWGCSKDFVRVDKVASQVCAELRMSVDDFAKLLDKAIATSSLMEVHSEVAGYQFLPFSCRRINPKSYRKCYMRLRMNAQ